jgi:hypothetical protein
MASPDVNVIARQHVTSHVLYSIRRRVSLRPLVRAIPVVWLVSNHGADGTNAWGSRLLVFFFPYLNGTQQ